MRRVFRWHTAVFTTVALFVGCDDSSTGPTATPSKSAAAAVPADEAVDKAPAKRPAKGAKSLSPTQPD